MKLKKRFIVMALMLLMIMPSGMTRDDLLMPDGHLSLFNIHTLEYLRIDYLDPNGQVDKYALQTLSDFLRSPDTGEVKLFDPHLIVTLDQIQDRLGRDKTIEVICGYRSPDYNALLHSRSEGVARNSLHMEARAIDINIPGVNLQELFACAWGLQQGGVGYYPGRFIHVDTGPVRFW